MKVSELFRAHAGFVERVLRRAGVAERDVSDAAQEVFLVVQRRHGEFEGRSKARTWLYRIAWNVASETRRRAYRRHEVLELDYDPASCAPSALEQLQERQQLAALRAAVAALDDDKREALVHSELDERPLHELAERRGIPLKTAFSRLYAARRAVQQALRAQGLFCFPWPPLLSWRQLSAWLAPKSSSAVAAVAMLGVLVAPIPPPLDAPPSAAESEPRVVFLEFEPLRLRDLTAADRIVEPAPRKLARSRAKLRLAPKPMAASLEPEPEVAQPSAMRVVRTGAADLGLGPFGESSLAYPPRVAPQRHPRAKLGSR